MNKKILKLVPKKVVKNIKKCRSFLHKKNVNESIGKGMIFTDKLEIVNFLKKDKPT